MLVIPQGDGEAKRTKDGACRALGPGQIPSRWIESTNRFLIRTHFQHQQSWLRRLLISFVASPQTHVSRCQSMPEVANAILIFEAVCGAIVCYGLGMLIVRSLVDGVERTLRFLQASVQIILSLVVNSAAAYDAAVTIFKNREFRRTLAELSGRLGLVRRFFRFFRFCDAFTNSYNIFTSLNGSPNKQRTAHLEKSLDMLTGTFNGLYLLLEALTLVDALGISGLAILGPDLELVLKIESQRCWFLALAFGALACLIRLSELQNAARTKAASKKKPKKEGVENDAKQLDGSIEERTQATKTGALKWKISRKMLACLLDLALPGSLIGWIPASKGVVGAVMLTTSVLTGLDVWERCGKEVGKA